MNTITASLCSLGIFFASSIYYFIPCAIGSILSDIVRYKKHKKEKICISEALLYSIAPTILISSANCYLAMRITYDNIELGLAFICGFLASDINSILISIKTLIRTIMTVHKVFKNITDSNVLDTLQKLSDNMPDEGNKHEDNSDNEEHNDPP